MTANSALFKDLVETNRMGEILTDKNGRTSMKGIYAAGDVTDISYNRLSLRWVKGQRPHLLLSKIVCVVKSDEIWLVAALVHNL